jgi:hypothetical protein
VTGPGLRKKLAQILATWEAVDLEEKNKSMEKEKAQAFETVAVHEIIE